MSHTYKLRVSAVLALYVASKSLMAEPSTTEFADTVMTLPPVSVTYIKSGAQPDRVEAVTTLGQAEIERLNLVNIKQVSEIAPNFYMPQYGSRMTSSVYVRGLGTRIDQPVVGLNIDNVPLINKDNFDFDLSDITRIEILRGPQNILYGRNTMGGLINIYTLSPLSFEGVKLQAEYGSANSYKATAGITAAWHAHSVCRSISMLQAPTDSTTTHTTTAKSDANANGAHDGKPSGALAAR